MSIGPGLAGLAALSLAAASARAGDELAEPRLVRALHLDLLGRTPTSKEAAAAAEASPAALVARLAGSREFWQAWYEDELYYLLLIDGFRPTAPAVAEIPAELHRGSLTAPQAFHRILLSPNFSARNPGADTFVTVVFEQCLGVTVQDNPALLGAGKRMYDGQAASIFGQAGRGQADVVKISLAQPAFLRELARREWGRLFGSPLPRDEAARAEAMLRERPEAFADLVREWASSTAYAERLRRPRAKSALQFVRSLFVDLLDRPPTPEEFQWTRNATRALSDPGPLRAVIARLLLASGKSVAPKAFPEDRAAWVRAEFRRLLAREPAPSEVEAFLAPLGEEGVVPGEVIEALVTHPEYGFY